MTDPYNTTPSVPTAAVPLGDTMITTAFELPGYRIVRNVGVVRGPLAAGSAVVPSQTFAPRSNDREPAATAVPRIQQPARRAAASRVRSRGTRPGTTTRTIAASQLAPLDDGDAAAGVDYWTG